MVFGVLFLAVIVALFALAFSFILNIVRPATSFKRRVLMAALGAGFIPAIPAFVVVGAEVYSQAEGLVAISAIFVIALFLAAVIGFPVSYFLTRRLGRGIADAPDHDVFN